MQLNRRKAKNALVKKGFQLRETKTHTMFTFYLGEKITVAQTRMSRGSNNKDIGDYLIGEMSRDCHLSKNKFIDLINCSVSKDDYEKHIAEINQPESNPN